MDTLTHDATRLAEELRPALTALTLMLRREAQHSALSPSQATLLATLRDRGPRRIGDLAAVLNVSQPSTTVLVNRLERQRLTTRTPDPHDHRAVLVALTDHGRQVIAEAADLRTALLAERLARLTPHARAAIAAAVPALTQLATENPA